MWSYIILILIHLGSWIFFEIAGELCQLQSVVSTGHHHNHARPAQQLSTTGPAPAPFQMPTSPPAPPPLFVVPPSYEPSDAPSGLLPFVAPSPLVVPVISNPTQPKLSGVFLWPSRLDGTNVHQIYCSPNLHLIGMHLKWNLRSLPSIKMTLIGAHWSNHFLNLQSTHIKTFFKQVVRIAQQNQQLNVQVLVISIQHNWDTTKAFSWILWPSRLDETITDFIALELNTWSEVFFLIFVLMKKILISACWSKHSSTINLLICNFSRSLYPIHRLGPGHQQPNTTGLQLYLCNGCKEPCHGLF